LDDVTATPEAKIGLVSTSAAMTNSGRTEKAELLGCGYELFIALLSVLSVSNSALILLAVLGPLRAGPASEVVLGMDAVLTPIFAFDFLYRYRSAPDRITYMVRWRGWADLVACVPLLRVFKLVRLARVVRSFRALGRERVVSEIDGNRALSIFLLTIFLVVVVLEFACATIYYAEKGAPGSNIASAEDAIWWGVVTITTVGYGDRYPVTTAGRLIGVFLLVAGIGLFSVLTAFLANALVSPRKRRRGSEGSGDLAAALADVRALLREQAERTGVALERIDDLERSLVAPQSSAGGSRDGDPATNHAGAGEGDKRKR
jgi:voltage-gated potassium channel